MTRKRRHVQRVLIEHADAFGQRVGRWGGILRGVRPAIFRRRSAVDNRRIFIQGAFAGSVFPYQA